MARKTPGGTPATVALDRAGARYQIHSYQHDPRAASFGDEAAELLGVPPYQVFKTLLADTGHGLVVGVVPVNRRLDLKSLARAVDAKKVELATPAAAERSTGMVVGGISPIGQKKRLPTVIDESATNHDTIYVSAGARGLDLELAPDVLAALLSAKFAHISR